MDHQRLRSFALALPEVTEAPHFEKLSFRVRGKIFATLPPDEPFVHIFVDEHAVQAFVSADPQTYEALI